VIIGILSSSLTSLSIFKAISSPIPVNEFKRVLFAFLNDPLKINGISNLSVIDFRVLAIFNVSSLDSIMQGPAIKKKLLFPINFKFLILFITKRLYIFEDMLQFHMNFLLAHNI
jgi:hypothetical protein